MTNADRYIEEQIQDIAAAGYTDESVHAAFAAVWREAQIDALLTDSAARDAQQEGPRSQQPGSEAGQEDGPTKEGPDAPSATGASPSGEAIASAQIEQDGRRIAVTCSGPAGSHERLAEAATAALKAAVIQLYPPFYPPF